MELKKIGMNILKKIKLIVPIKPPYFIIKILPYLLLKYPEINSLIISPKNAKILKEKKFPFILFKVNSIP